MTSITIPLRNPKMPKTFLACLFVFFILNSTLNSDENSKTITSKFAHEVFQVKPHPQAQFEVLENGMRIILLPNRIPEKKVLVKLYVNAGSLNETENQQGIAEFITLMAFNGTKKFTSKAIYDFVKSTNTNETKVNKFVDFDKTTYSFTLNDELLRQETIEILAEFVTNIQFKTDDIERIKPITIKERADRITPEYRVIYETFQLAFPNSLLANRFTIGKGEVIQKFSKEDFVDYYNTWYHPENVTLIVTGDINSQEWLKIIKKEFANFTPRAPLKATPIIKEISHNGIKTNYIPDKNANETKAEIRTIIFNGHLPIDYIAYRKKNIAASAARYLLNKRSAERFGKKDLPYSVCRITIANIFENIDFGNIWITGKKENWKELLTFIENELRKTLKYGFFDEEFNNYKRDYLIYLNSSLIKSKSADSNFYMEQIVTSINKKMPFQDSYQFFEVEKNLLDALTKEDINNELRRFFNVDHRLISIFGNAEITNAKDEIIKCFEIASKIEVKNEPVFPVLPKEAEKK